MGGPESFLLGTVKSAGLSRHAAAEAGRPGQVPAVALIPSMRRALSGNIPFSSGCRNGGTGHSARPSWTRERGDDDSSHRPGQGFTPLLIWRDRPSPDVAARTTRRGEQTKARPMPHLFNLPYGSSPERDIPSRRRSPPIPPSRRFHFDVESWLLFPVEKLAHPVSLPRRGRNQAGDLGMRVTSTQRISHPSATTRRSTWRSVHSCRRPR